MPPADQETPGQPIDPRDREIIELRACLAELNQQLNLARQDVAETNDQLLIATARATEMEHHLHRRIIEVTELRKQLDSSDGGGSSESRGNPVTRRFSPLLARTTLRLQRSEQ